MVKRNILLNPGPATTTDRVKQAQIVPDICPREQEFGDLGKRIRQKVLQVVHGQESHVSVLYSGSGTAAVESCLSSLIGPEQRILILDNGAYGKRAEQIVQSYGIPHLTYRIAWGNYPQIEALESILQDNPDLTHFFFVHHETTTGMLNPLPELLNLCQRHKLVSIVDAMSSYAGIPIDLRELPIDFLAASSNKAIQGFAGIGIVIARKTLLEDSQKLPPRNFYFHLYQNYQYWEKSNQFQFTPPVQTLYALEEALDEFFEETQEERYQRYCSAYEVLIQGLQELELECLLPPEQHSKLLTAIIEPNHLPQYSFNALHDYLYEQGITIYPGKGATKDTFRIANIGAIDQQDMKLAIQEMKNFFASLA